MKNITVFIFDKAKKIERFLIVSMFLFMVFAFSFGILVREFPIQIANHFSWIEELVKIMNLYLIFITLGLALEKGRHVRIPILLNKLNSSAKLLLTKLIDILGLSFTCYLFFLSIDLVVLVFKSGQVSPTLNVSMAIIYLAPAIGFFSISVRYVLSLFGFINRFENGDIV